MDKRRMGQAAVAAAVVGAAAVAVVALQAGGGASAGAGRSARVQLHDVNGADVGTVYVIDRRDGAQVRVDLHLDPAAAATDTYHGFHVHANDDPANGEGCIAGPAAAPTTWFTSVDGHWKTAGQSHSAHLGDLASVYVTSDGTAEAQFTTQRFRAADLAGRAIVLHAGPDNFGNVPVGAAASQYTANSADATTATANTGNAGARIACGVVG